MFLGEPRFAGTSSISLIDSASLHVLRPATASSDVSADSTNSLSRAVFDSEPAFEAASELPLQFWGASRDCGGTFLEQKF